MMASTSEEGELNREESVKRPRSPSVAEGETPESKRCKADGSEAAKEQKDTPIDLEASASSHSEDGDKLDDVLLEEEPDAECRLSIIPWETVHEDESLISQAFRLSQRQGHPHANRLFIDGVCCKDIQDAKGEVVLAAGSRVDFVKWMPESSCADVGAAGGRLIECQVQVVLRAQKVCK
jgi:hypothetical protein